MARKQMIEGGTKNRIREVGGRQIFEHGYDGTSVRGIMLEVGGEVGLFYYYYKTAISSTPAATFRIRMDFVLITPSSFFFLFLLYSLAFSAAKTIRRRYKKRNRACAKSTSKNEKVWTGKPFGL